MTDEDDGERRCDNCGDSYNVEEHGGEEVDNGYCITATCQAIAEPENADTYLTAGGIRGDYNICPSNDDGKHGPVVAHIDLEIAKTHVAVACDACGTTTGYPIAEFADNLEWN